MARFRDLELLSTLVQSLSDQGIRQPTEIQTNTIPPQLAGRSVLGIAETGSGKTLAYVLPLLHRLKTLELDGSAVSEPGQPRGLVLVPGRELGEQVSKVFKSLTHGTRLRVRVALGGMARKVARRNVSGAFEILVATPGRLTQLLDGEDLSLSDLRTVVLDEADQMVDPGFLPVAQRVLQESPRGVQVATFSATLPGPLEHVLSELFAEPPLKVKTAGAQRLVETLERVRIDVINGRREEALLEVLSRGRRIGTILFVNTREQLERVTEWLAAEGLPHVQYSGEMNRLERRANLAAFRDGAVWLLLTTDLGSRGLDIDRVDRVINVHMPGRVDSYLHRVGRTARAGRAGQVVDIVTQRDHTLLAKLKRKGVLPG